MHQLNSQATCAVVENPMFPYAAQPRAVRPDTLIRDLDPKGKFPAICRVDGQWVLRKDWDKPIGFRRVEFFIYPQGGGGGGSDVGRTLLMIAAVYVAVTFGAPEIAAAFPSLKASADAIAIFAATTLVNALVPVAAPDGSGFGGGTASTTYTANLSGNQSRLDEPIPVLYGRNKTFPNFAAEPYATYDDNDDQYYNALLCLGQGQYVIESINIDDTNIDNFQDVVVKAVLPPGTAPSFVAANIVNAPEVTGNEVLEARYTGPFIGCRPKAKAAKISIDIGFSRGLASYNASTGAPENKTVTWRVEYRAVDDFGNGSLEDTPGVWTVLANESLTAAQTAPLRRTYTYELPATCRPQVRVIRTNAFDSSNRVANTLEWLGLRCHLAAPAPLCPAATHIEIVMRASEQLSGLTQRKIHVISRRLLRKWAPGTGWTALQETRNPAWALADKWTNATYGDGYPDGRCDLEGLYDLSLVWETRQDRFDGVFDQTYDSHQADQMIAQAGRAAAFRRNTLMTVSRDQLHDLPVTAFTARNIQPGSLSLDYQFANEATPDGVIVEYWDNRGWDWTEILVPAPGVVAPVRPHRLRLFGVTGAKHAEREGIYHISNYYYRRKYATFATELEGMIPSFGSAVVFAPSLPNWGRGGDLVNLDTSTLVATLSEPPTWEDGQAHYISFLTKDGSLSSPYPVTRGPGEYAVQLASYPTDYTAIADPGRERTKYVFGSGTPYPAVLRVLSLRNSADASGVRSFTIYGVIEDDRVHYADVHLLPGEGVVQDPTDPRAEPLSGVNSSGYGRVPTLGISAYDEVAAYMMASKLVLTNTAQAFVYRQLGAGDYGDARRIPDWWLLAAGQAYGSGPFTPSDAALFQVRATLVQGDPPLGAGLDTWLSLGTERTWYVSAVGPGAAVECVINLEIREASTSILQAAAYGVRLRAYDAPLEGG